MLGKVNNIFFSLLFCISSFAQNNTETFLYDEYLSKSLEYQNIGNLEQAILWGEKAKMSAEEELASDDEYAFVLGNLGGLMYFTEEYQKAESLYNRAIKILEENELKTTTYYATFIGNLAEVFFTTKNYEKAESYYIQAISAKKEIGEDDNLSFVTVLNNLALIYKEKKKYSEAEFVFLKAIDIIKKIPENLKYEQAVISRNLADVYRLTNEYTKAESQYLQTIGIRKETPDYDKDIDYAILLNDFAELYAYNKEYSKAEQLYLESKGVFESIDNCSSNYVKLLDNLGQLYFHKEEYNKTEQLYIKVLKIYEDILNESNFEDYILCFNSLIDLYGVTNRYLETEQFFLHALSLAKKVFGEQQFQYSNVFDGLADFYYTTGQYSIAEKYYLKRIKIKEKIFGKETHHYSSALHSMGIFFHTIGRYSDSERYYKNAIALTKNTENKDSINYATYSFSLANLYSVTGRYSEAETLFEESIAILEKDSTKNELDFALQLYDLSEFYNNQGKYSLSEPLFAKIITILNNENHDEKAMKYDSYLHRLANIYSYVGDTYKAEKNYLKAIEANKRVGGIYSKEYSVLISNLGALYTRMKKYSEAESLFLNAIDNLEKSPYEFNYSQALFYINLAGIYYMSAKYKQSEHCYLKGLNLFENTLGENHLEFITSLNNLGVLYSKIEDYSKAEFYALKVLSLHEKYFGDNHPCHEIYLVNLGLIYEVLKQYEKSEPLYLRAYSKGVDYISNYFTFLTETERSRFWETKKNSFESIYPAFSCFYYSQKPSISILAYNNALTTKGILLNTSIQINKKIFKDETLESQNIFENITSIKQQISNLYNNPPAEQSNLQTLIELADRLEKDLVLKSQTYSQTKKDLDINWEKIQKSLMSDEVAIEFIHFKDDINNYTIYYALLLDKDCEFPKLIPLFEEKQLDTIFQSNKYSYDIYNIPKRSSSLRNPTKDINYGKQLYDLVWKPIEPYLTNIDKIYYTPTGKLHQISFAAIPINSDSVLMQKYNLHQLTSTREIIHENNIVEEIKNVALFGGIKYSVDKQEGSIAFAPAEMNYRSAFIQPERDGQKKEFNYLDNTHIEVQNIENTLNSFNRYTKLYEDIHASEKAFKELSGRNFDLIHIATHGFYLPSEKVFEEKFSYLNFTDNNKKILIDNPLLRSGLVLSGGNRAWLGEPISSQGEDGVLTSYEISQLNLENIKMVVLSACETGLGDINGYEGVFGLQRAFKMAGVQTILMSLWRVPDAETSELMQLFYKYWLSGEMDKRAALKKAQIEMYKKNPSNIKAWAAFVMID